MFQNITVCLDTCFRFYITLIDNFFYFPVNRCRCRLAESTAVRQISADKDFVLLITVGHHTHIGRHTIFCHHCFGDACGTADIFGCTGGDIVKDQFLCDSSTKAYFNIFQHLSSGIKHLIPVRKWHRITRCTGSRRNNGDCIHRIHLFEHMEQDCVTCFMVRCDLFLFFRDHAAVFFRSDTDFDKCFLDIFLAKELTILFCCQDGRFIQQILQFRSCKSCGGLCDLWQIHIISQGFALCMNLQDLLSSTDIRCTYRNGTVKSSRTKNGRIQDIHTVGCCHHDDSLINPETIHLYQ